MLGAKNEKVLETLVARSHPRARSMRDVAFPEALEADAWLMTPELVSLSGLSVFEAMSVEEQKALARLEAVSFFSLNVHGERLLIEGIARRLDRDGDALRSEYLHHMLEEESEHMTTFARICRTYHGGIYQSRHVPLTRQTDSDEETLVFFARIVLFEERVDTFNRLIADDERVHPFVREIHALHHLDEVRHLAFGRLIVRELAREHMPKWTTEKRARVQSHLSAFASASAHEFANVDVYREAGLEEPFALRRAVIASAPFRARMASALARSTRLFAELGLPLSEECHV